MARIPTFSNHQSFQQIGASAVRSRRTAMNGKGSIPAHLRHRDIRTRRDRLLAKKPESSPMAPVRYFGFQCFQQFGDLLFAQRQPQGNEYMRFVQLVSSNPNPQNARSGHSREARFRYRIYSLTAVTSL